jgi:hypothetical protein
VLAVQNCSRRGVNKACSPDVCCKGSCDKANSNASIHQGPDSMHTRSISWSVRCLPWCLEHMPAVAVRTVQSPPPPRMPAAPDIRLNCSVMKLHASQAHLVKALIQFFGAPRRWIRTMGTSICGAPQLLPMRLYSCYVSSPA